MELQQHLTLEQKSTLFAEETLFDISFHSILKDMYQPCGSVLDLGETVQDKRTISSLIRVSHKRNIDQLMINIDYTGDVITASTGIIRADTIKPMTLRRICVEFLGYENARPFHGLYAGVVNSNGSLAFQFKEYLEESEYLVNLVPAPNVDSNIHIIDNEDNRVIFIPLYSKKHKNYINLSPCEDGFVEEPDHNLVNNREDILSYDNEKYGLDENYALEVEDKILSSFSHKDGCYNKLNKPQATTPTFFEKVVRFFKNLF